MISNIEKISIDIKDMIVEIKCKKETFIWKVYPATIEGVIYELGQLKNLFYQKNEKKT